MDETAASAMHGLESLAGALAGSSIDLAGEAAEAHRITVLRSITDYLLPRLAEPGGPLVVAIVGQSGSGKSTLLNSLAESQVSPAGPLRPTTTRPVAFVGDRSTSLLDPLLERLAGDLVTGGRPPPEGIVLVDSPPPVVAHDGVAGAHQVLASADACVFVAGAIRYADAAGWDLIEEIARRQLPTVYVLNRLPSAPETQQQLLEDMARRLAAAGLLMRPAAEMIVGLGEGTILGGIGGLARDQVSLLRKELEALADVQTRRRLREAVVEAALEDVELSLPRVRFSLAEEARLHHELRSSAIEPYRRHADVLRAEVAAGRLSRLARGGPEAVSDLAAVVTRRASMAAREAAERWERHRVGRELLDQDGGLWTHDPVTIDIARERIGEWMSGLEALVTEVGGKWRPWVPRRRRVAAALCRLVFDPTWVPSSRLNRRLERLDGLEGRARAELDDVLSAVLARDALRYSTLAGRGVPNGIHKRIVFDPGNAVRSSPRDMIEDETADD